MLDTLSNVKSRLGITSTTYDTFLTAQITLVSDVIEAYCRRKFAEADWVQTFYRSDLTSASFLETFHFPLTGVTSIVIDDVEQDLDEMRIHEPTGRIRRSNGGSLYGEEIVVSYSAGYASIPTPILAVLDSVVEERYNKKVAGVSLNFGSDVQRISIPGAIAIDFDYSLQNNQRSSAYGTILGSHVNVLDDWRSERSVVGNSKLEYVEEDV